MILEPLTRDDAEQVRIWRNLPQMQATLRTAKRLTYDEQQDWYTREIANRESHTRYWALVDNSELVNVTSYGSDAPTFEAVMVDSDVRTLVGYGGIEHISWENRNGELSVLIDPDRHGKGLGSEAVALFLDQAFNYLNLDVVYGECYACGPWRFWKKQLAIHGCENEAEWLPSRKYYKRTYYDSYCFTFFKDNFV